MDPDRYRLSSLPPVVRPGIDQTVPNPGVEVTQLPILPVVPPPDSLETLEPQVMEEVPVETPLVVSPPEGLVKSSPGRVSLFAFNWRALLLATVTVVAICALTLGGILLTNHKSKDNGSTANKYGVGQLSLSGVTDQLQQTTDSTLSVNGRLTVNQDFVLVPTNTPSNPAVGQIYLNDTDRQLYYYDGQAFINLATGTQTAGLTTMSRANPGEGLALNGASLNNTGVLSLQGQTGNVSMTAGSGIALNGLSITNTGVTVLRGTVNQISVSQSNGDVTLSLPQSIATTSSPTFANLTLTGATANGVLIGGGSSPITSVTAAAAGLCLVSTGTAPAFPTFSSCTGGASVTSVNSLTGALNVVAGSGVTIASDGTDTLTVSAVGGGGGVTSVNGQTGVLTVANATATGGTITLDDATASSKGIASFTSGDFSVSGGVVSLGTLVTKMGNSFNGSGQLVKLDTGGQATNTGQCLMSTSGGAAFASCPVGGNISSGASQTAGKLTKFDATTNRLTDSIISESGSALTVAGSLSATSFSGNGSGLTNLNAGNIASGTLDNSRLATSVTVQGNSFNGANQLLQLNGSGQLPAVSGVLLSSLNASSVTSGTLGVAYGGTGQSSFTVNGILLGNGAGGIGTITPGSDGNCLIMVSGVPTFGTCTGAGGVSSVNSGTGALTLQGTNGVTVSSASSGVITITGPTIGAAVTSLNGLNGSLSIANASGSGSTITIQNASGTQKGLAQFNTDNFSVSSGVVNTIQDITTSAAPTFGALNLQSASGVEVNAVNGTSQTRLSFATPSGGTTKTITVPNAVGTLAVSASGPLSLDSSGNITCATCLTSGGGGGTAGVSSITGANGGGALTGALSLAGANGVTITGTGTTLTITGPSAAAAVNSLNGQSGALTLADVTYNSGTSTFTINNASTSVKGIASFTAGDFSVSSGVVALGTSVTKLGNDVNVASGLVQLTAGGLLPALNGSLLTNLNADNIASGTVADARLSTNVTLQGNSFNNANQLVKLNASTQLPAVSGALLTNLNGSNIASGTVGVPRGGTGVGSFTLNGVLIGNGSSALAVTAAGAEGQCLVVNSSGVPEFNTCTGAGGVSSLNGLTGAISLAAGTGLNLAPSGNTLNLTNTGVVSLAGTTNQISVSASTGAVTLSLPQDIHASANVTFNTAALKGDNALSLGQSSTHTGSISFANSANANITTVQSGAAAGNLTFTLPTADGSSGQCLKTNSSGVLSFGNCVTTTNGVISLNGLAGAISIANATGSGSTVTIQNASTSQLGLAQFNDTNFSVSSGVVNTIQNIATTASPTFNQLSLTTLGATGATPLCLNTFSQISGCSGNAMLVTLQQAYNASSDPELTLDTIRGALSIRDASVPVSGNLLEVQNYARTSTYLAVSTSGVAVKGALALGNATNANSISISGTPAASYQLVLPSSLGTTGQCLQLADNSGTLQFVDCSSSGGGSSTAAPQARVYRSTAQSIAASTTNIGIAYDAERYDTDSMHSLLTNTTRMTINTAGTYDLSAPTCLTTYTSGNSTYLSVIVRLNGTTTLANDSIAGSTGNCANPSTTYQLNAGDYLEVVINNYTGSAYSANSDFAAVKVDGVGAGGTGGSVPAARAYNTSAQSIPNSTDTALTFNTDRYDTDNIHSTTTNTSRLTAQTAGIYAVTGEVIFAGNSSGTFRDLYVRLNGTTTVVQQNTKPDAAYNTRATITTMYYLNAGDYVELMTYQDSGGALSTVVNSPESPEFSITKMDGGLGGSLQGAYDSGNILTTSNARDIKFNLADTATDSNMIINIASGSTSQFQIQAAGVNTFTVNGTGQAVFKNSSNSTTAFQVQNQAGATIFGVDTQNSQALLGKASTLDGKLTFNNASNANTAAITSGATTSNYTLTLPTTLGSAGDCLKLADGTGTLTFSSSCGSGGGSGSTPSVRAYNTSSVSVPTGTLTAIPLNSERYDTGTLHDIGSNTSRLTASVAGTYSISGSVYWAGVTGGVQELNVRLNGTTIITYNGTAASSTSTGQNVSTLYYLNAGDYVELVAYQNNGTTRTITNGGNYSPEFGMTLLENGSADATLQGAYDTGNAITTTDGRDVTFNLANTSTTDANLTVNIASGSTGQFRVQANGTNTFSINDSGQTLLKNSSNSSTAFQVQNQSGVTLLGVDTSSSRIFSGIADGGSAVAFKLDTSAAYSTTGAKLLSVQNNGVEKFSIDKNGHVKYSSGTPTISYCSGMSSCSLTAGSNDVRGQIYFATVGYTNGTVCINYANAFATTPYTVVSAINPDLGTSFSSTINSYSASTTQLCITGPYNAGSSGAYVNYWNPE
jgi:hypothetical protein